MSSATTPIFSHSELGEKLVSLRQSSEDHDNFTRAAIGHEEQLKSALASLQVHGSSFILFFLDEDNLVISSRLIENEDDLFNAVLDYRHDPRAISTRAGSNRHTKLR